MKRARSRPGVRQQGKGKMNQEPVRWIKELEPMRLAFGPRPRGGEWLAEDIALWRASGVDSVVSLIEGAEERDLQLEEEPLFCRTYGIEFLSFTIKDRSVPASPDAVASLVDWVISDLRRGLGVLVHCRVGIGRSSVIAACVLHSLGHKHDTLFPILSRTRGVPVPDTPAQVDWVRRYTRSMAPSAAS
jgi:protein-tyrosine phosphatase